MKDMIILMGGQGSGKGTMATMLMETKTMNYIETGAMFRSLPKSSKIAKTIAAGILVPDPDLFRLLQPKFDISMDNLLDGFPRTKPQVEWLLDKYSTKFVIKTVYLNIPESIMMQRIKNRLIMGGGRADDNNETAIRRRLDTFQKETIPTINILQQCHNVQFIDIDATPSIDQVFKNLTSALSR